MDAASPDIGLLFNDAVGHYNAGHLAAAEQISRRILTIDAGHADSLHLAGVISCRLGQYDAGTGLIRNAIAMNANAARYHLDLGRALQAQDKLGDAMACYDRALTLQPDHADAHNNRGSILLAQGRLDDAMACYDRALGWQPDHADAHNNRGNILMARGRLDDAMACYDRALALKPDHADADNNRGNVFMAQGRLDDAMACYDRALASQPDHPHAHNNRGTVLLAQGRLDEAMACYDRAVALKPDYPEAHNHRGSILMGQGRLDDAAACYDRALASQPDYPEAHLNRGTVLLAQGRLDEAMACYDRALACKPDLAAAYTGRGNVLRAQGRLDEAMACYDRALGLQPDNAEAHFSRAQIKRFRAADVDLQALENLVAEPGTMPAAKAVFAHFALGKALEDVGECARAFEHMLKGNALKRQQLDYSRPGLGAYTDTEAFFGRIMALFDTGLFERLQRGGDPSELPIFILGMPRSGSTLTEQILASHPLVHGGDELTTLARVANSVAIPGGQRRVYYPAYAPALATLGRRLGRSYVAQLPKLPDGKVRITDKMPENFLMVGLIHYILPNARIIHTMRDPADTCVSCFSHLFFDGHYYSYDLAELGRFYAHYHKLMAHWRSVLPPGVMLDVSYEEVVENFEEQARRIIAFCGLPWHDGCLEFHKSTRSVLTASAVQVRQPLFRSSLKRWRRYENFLHPLVRELGELHRP